MISEAGGFATSASRNTIFRSSREIENEQPTFLKALLFFAHFQTPLKDLVELLGLIGFQNIALSLNVSGLLSP